MCKVEVVDSFSNQLGVRIYGGNCKAHQDLNMSTLLSVRAHWAVASDSSLGESLAQKID